MKLIVVAIAVAAASTVGALAVYSGAYDIAATEQHLAPTYWLLDVAMQRSVRQRAKDIPVPPLDSPAMIERGLALYRLHCVHCHGAPGIAPEPFAIGMNPGPANLAHTARAWAPGDLFYVIRQGIKMTGMPAWEFRLDDDELWAIVAFLKRLPLLSPQQYQSLAASVPPASTERQEPPDAGRGKRAILQYACATCHAIPGIVGANAPVGPPLDKVGTRAVIAGVLPNTPSNMVRWLRAPQAIKPGSAMPALGLTERDARDMASYLATLR